MFVIVVAVCSVVVGVSIGFEHTGTFRVGYGTLGGRHGCWITSKRGKLYLYLIPSYISIFISFALLIFIVRNMNRNMAPGISANNNNINLPAMTLKLACAFGLAEIISLIEVGRENETGAIIDHVLSLLYSSLRCSRGILLFAVLFFSKNVSDHLRDRVRSRTNDATNMTVPTYRTQESSM